MNNDKRRKDAVFVILYSLVGYLLILLVAR
jgi:hypothetical protein